MIFENRPLSGRAPGDDFDYFVAGILSRRKRGFMGESLEWVKRIGAGLIIVVLAGMLILTFGRVSPSQLADLMSGRVGSFNGDEISQNLYFMAEENCKQNMAAYGQIPPYILHNCVSTTLKQLYVLPLVASRLGLRVSEESQQTEMMKYAQQMFESQKGVTPDDRLTVREIYNRQLLNNPLDVQIRRREAQNGYEAVSAVGDNKGEARAVAAAEQVSVSLRLVRFTIPDLQNKVGDVKVPEEDIKARFDKEQSVFQPAQRKSYESEHELVKARIIGEKKMEAVSGLKQQLSGLGKDFKLEDVERITGRNAATQNLRLSELKEVKLPTGEVVHLDSAEILLALAGKENKKIGPIQDGEATLYLEILNVQAPPVIADSDKRVEKLIEERHNETSRAYFDMIIKQEARRGKFHLKTDAAQQPGVSQPNFDF